MVPEGLLFPSRKRERWRVPARAQMIYHSELEITLLFTELAASDTPDDRKIELRQEIRQRLHRIRRRTAMLSQLGRLHEEQGGTEAEEDTSASEGEQPDTESHSGKQQRGD